MKIRGFVDLRIIGKDEVREYHYENAITGDGKAVIMGIMANATNVTFADGSTMSSMSDFSGIKQVNIVYSGGNITASTTAGSITTDTNYANVSYTASYTNTTGSSISVTELDLQFECTVTPSGSTTTQTEYKNFSTVSNPTDTSGNALTIDNDYKLEITWTIQLQDSSVS